MEDTDVSALLNGVRVTTTLFGMAHLPVDWGVEFPPSRGGAYFHVVHGGAGFVHVHDRPPQRLAQGEVALLAHGTPHRITGTNEGRARVRFDPVSWTPNVISGRRDATPTGMTLICATVESHGRSRPELLGSMPDVLLVPGGGSVGLTVQSLQHEALDGGAGRETVLARLGDALLVQLVRWWLQERAGDAMPISAFADSRIGPVLRAVNADLRGPWTIEAMARLAALSRSRFTERFRELVGVAPGQYLAGQRLDAARDLLAHGESIRSVSRSVGYASEQSFSRAFSRRHGLPPSRVLDDRLPASRHPAGGTGQREAPSSRETLRAASRNASRTDSATGQSVVGTTTPIAPTGLP